MVKRFFNGGSTPSNSIVNDTLITLLSGPPSCGKTSLLFQFAFNMVVQSESQGYVVFICNRRRFQSKPTFLSQGIDDSSPIFDRIQIKYVDDYDDESLKKYFSAFHLLNPFPLAVIIDDFGDFFLDSFGVVLLELITGKNAIVICQAASRMNLVQWVIPKFNTGDINSIVDQRLGEIDRYPKFHMDNYRNSNEMCFKATAEERPIMTDILTDLRALTMRLDAAGDYIKSPDSIEMTRPVLGSSEMAPVPW